MTRHPAMYILFLVIIIVAIFAINYIVIHYFPSAPGTAATALTTVPPGTNNTGTGAGTGNASASNSTTTVLAPVLGSCIQRTPSIPLYNGNFSSGTYDGWNVSGNGFGATPFNISYANARGYYYAAPWGNYSGNFVATTYRVGTLVSPGNITSRQFQVTEPYLNFKLISPQDNYLYVEILENGKPFMRNHYNTFAAPGNLNPQTNFINVSISVAPLMCQNATVRIVAGVVSTHTTKYEYIAAGDFYLSNTPHNTPGILVNTTII